jgi:hypothetical protein
VSAADQEAAIRKALSREKPGTLAYDRDQTALAALAALAAQIPQTPEACLTRAVELDGNSCFPHSLTDEIERYLVEWKVAT